MHWSYRSLALGHQYGDSIFWNGYHSINPISAQSSWPDADTKCYPKPVTFLLAWYWCRIRLTPLRQHLQLTWDRPKQTNTDTQQTYMHTHDIYMQTQEYLIPEHKYIWEGMIDNLYVVWMHHISGSTLDQATAYCLFSTKLLPQPMQKYCHLDLWTNLSEIWIKIQYFSFMTMHFRMLSATWQLFCSGLMCQK